jgi:CubicO group peptidase (beta-lactamase class C family)
MQITLKKISVLFIAACSVIIVRAQQNPNELYQAPVFADKERAAKIKALAPVIQMMYSNYAKANHFPSFSFGVVVDGELILSGSEGYSNIANQTRANTRTMYRIASMSKSVTAMAIIKLRDEGKLKLDDPVSNYIPELKNQALTKDAASITIRELLTHSSGLPEDNPWGDRQLADTDEELIELFKKQISFSNVNGTEYEYSNVGFATLGLIIKKVTGLPYSEYINQHFFKRLGMQAAWEYTKVPADQLAKGYRYVNNNFKEEALLHDGIYGAMGGLITSVESFSKYMALHQQAWPARNEPENIIINRSSIREMHQPWRFASMNPYFNYGNGIACPAVSAYGYGLNIFRDCNNKVYVGHSGGLPGFGSNWRIMPEYGIGVVLLANVTYAPTTSINLKVLDSVIKLAGLKPRNIPVSTILNQRKNELIKLLPNFTNAKQSGIFAENFFDDYYTDSLVKQANTAFQNIGRVTTIEELIPENQLRGSFIINGEKGKLKIFFTLTPENPSLIQEYRLNLVK